MGRHIESKTWTFNSTGTKEPFLCDEPGIRMFQISGSFATLSMSIQGSIMGTAWEPLESGINAAVPFVNFAIWPMYRFVISTLTGGTVTIDFAFAKELRSG